MKYVYEFIGTFFLVFTFGMTAFNPDSAGIMAPLAIGSILAVMVFAGAYASGAHFNPAVTLAVFIRKKLHLRDLWFYWIVQLAAGVVAGYVTLYFKGNVSGMDINLDTMKVLVAEFIFTFALCFVVLNVITTKATEGNSFYGFAVGFTVLAGAYAVGAVSSAAFNPAVALGMAIMDMGMWPNIWIFFVANLLGGACAAWVYQSTHHHVES